MRTTIEKVRAAVVVGAALLALMVAGFLLAAHYKAHRLLGGLPARLGADIQKETSGYTYSQSLKGRTVFTIHAAKATQHKDGRTGLEDVGIVLYGQKDGRADRIYGKQFEYDQKSGVVRAMGEVQLDLQAPAPPGAAARAEYAGGGTEETKASTAEAQPIHVVTSGLVYVQRLGVASTDQPIRFSYRGMTGQARGAAYHADTGVTTLESDVRVATVREGRPTVLTAAHAELDRVSHELTLGTARYVALSKVESERGEGETMTARTMVVHLGQDGGGIERLEGRNGVTVASGMSRIEAPEGALRMNAAGRPEIAQMTGGVRFASDQQDPGRPGGTLEGQAASGVTHFDARGAIEGVQLTGGVQARSQGATAAEVRTMEGEAMDLRLAGEAGGSRRWIEQATLKGNARVESALPAVAGHTAGSEAMRADVLIGTWRLEQGGSVLRAMTGEGHSEIRRSRDGVEEVSRGGRLRAEFGVVAGSAGATARQGITTATQEGSVALERVIQAKNGQSETTRGRAERASYDAGSGQVSLAGEAEIADATSTLRAERVTMTEGSGDAEAMGAVQVTYWRAPASKQEATREGVRAGAGEDGEEPIHAIAEHAVMRKETGVTTFFGGTSSPRGGTAGLRARLWQGGSQVEAPVLVFGRESATLDAYGTSAGEVLPVRTVLVSRPEQGRESATVGDPKGRPQVLRVQSGRLHYADALRRAEFSKGVVLEEANGTMTSRDAVAMLAQVAKGTAGSGGETPKDRAKGAGEFSGLSGLSKAGLDRVLATGDVVIRQPGRVATGQQAMYTAADGGFVLTGTGNVRPTATDETNGSVTGAALRFRSGDNSVMVDGRVKDGTAVAGDGRVHTRTRVKQ